MDKDLQSLKIFSRIASIGSSPDDSDDIKLQKSLLVICAVPFMFLAIIWGSIYILFGEKLAGLIPLSYSAISIFSVIYFGITRKYHIFRFSQLLFILVLPSVLMFALGGFVNGSGVILWSLICPLGALLFEKRKHAPYWLAAFAALVILSAVIEPWLTYETSLSTGMINFFFAMNFAGVGSLVFLLVHYFVGQKDIFQERSENLLLNILPKEIVAMLKEGQRTIAEHFEGASILFADVANFTPMSSEMAPAELVGMLNDVFSKFDEMAEKYGLEKIKTIGDCYMVAAGVPRSRSDHAIVLTEMAVEMRDFVERNMFRGQKLNFRFGINSGPVVAGVIGRKKFSYDLWGDSVNIASRMETQGYNGAVQITQATYNLIKDYFICEFQGTVNVKGKGAMSVWYVVGKKEDIAVAV